MADLVGERYEPLAVVARGQEAEVVKARDHLSGRLVALQVRHLVSLRELDGLVNDVIDLIDVARYPGLPLVREHFLLDDTYYVVMDWVEGQRLDHVLRSDGRPGLPFEPVLDHLISVSAALEHLHTQKSPVVHQNVRPANLLLTADRGVVLVGYRMSSRWGMAPVALAERPTPATDVYGLAVTAHTLLTGAPPQPGTVPRFSGLSDAEAEGVLRALRRGYDPDPARRPATPTALVEELMAEATALMLPPPDIAAPPATVEVEIEVEIEEVEPEPEEAAPALLETHLDLEEPIDAEETIDLTAGTDLELDLVFEEGLDREEDLDIRLEAELAAVHTRLEADLEAVQSRFGADLEGVFSTLEADLVSELATPEGAAEPTVVAPEEHPSPSVEREGDRVQQIARSNRLRGGLAAVLVLLVGVTLLQVRSARAERNELRRLQLVSVAQALAARVDTEIRAGNHERAALLARQAELFDRQTGATAAAEVDRALRAALTAPNFSRVVNQARGGLWSLALSPDGTRMAAAGSTVRLVDLQIPESPKVALSGHLGPITSVAFSPDGKTLATGGDDPAVRLWNLSPPGAPPVLLEGHTAQVTSVAYGFAGQRLATASRDGTVRLWDLGSTPPTASVLSGHAGAVTSLAFTADGARLATAGADGLVRIWDALQPASVASLPVGTAVTAVAYSPDGRYVATGGDDQLVRLWDLSLPGSTPQILTGHAGKVSALAFRTDGTALVSGSEDQTVRIWPLTGGPPTVLTGHTGAVSSVAFSPAGDVVVSASADGTARHWRLGAPTTAAALHADPTIDRTVLSDLVCHQVGRNLSRGEWEEFVGPGVDYRRTCAGLPRD